MLRLVWIFGATGCAVAMYLLPGRETIPFHLIWIGLALLYGFTVWRPLEMVVMVVITAAGTGAILVHSAAMGGIDWAETAEVPLSVALTAVIASYLRRRHAALTELARIAEARQLLVRQVSHELRTPITIARGYTELVRNRLADPAAVEDADIVLEELDKLAQITQRLVTLIQIDGSFDREPLPLDTELERVVRRWMPAADRRWSVRASPGAVPANRDRLEAALDCLLDNAVRFTANGDSISVIGTVDHRSWTVEVADSGVGMPARDAARLTAAEPLLRNASSGSGLGLATVRSIAGAWGGVLKVRAEPGAGTVVTLRFPIEDDSSVINIAGRLGDS